MSGLTLNEALRLTECVFAWSLGIQTIEYLRMRAATSEQGLWAWSLQRLDIPMPGLRPVLDVLFAPAVHQLHLALRLLRSEEHTSELQSH